MASDHTKIIMIGLPETGKTTFLAALWHVVNSSDEVPNALRLYKLQGNDAYLNQIRDSWLEYLQVGRTRVETIELVSMELIRATGEGIVKVFFPDVSGEYFRQQVEERQCRKDYFKQVQEAAGILLFIHTGNIDRGTRIDELISLAHTIQDEADKSGVSPQGKVTPWKISLEPTQVKLVELLQFLCNIPDVKSPFRIAIILSAWDLNQELISPRVFLEKRLPLLCQYIMANPEAFITNVYGISAQGGCLDNEESRRRLADESKVPSDRIIVKSEDVDSHDITKPVKWLMECTDDEN